MGTMSDEREIEMATRLRNAYKQGPIEPISGKAAADITSAYRIQNINTEYALTVQGRRLIGRLECGAELHGKRGIR